MENRDHDESYNYAVLVVVSKWDADRDNNDTFDLFCAWMNIFVIAKWIENYLTEVEYLIKQIIILLHLF